MKNRLSYRFVAAAKKSDPVELLIYEQIGQTWLGDGLTAKRFRTDLRDHAGKNLRVRINSGGGSVFDGLSIYHALLEHGKDNTVTVVVDGVAASIASIIAMAGTEIIVKQGALLMVHNPWTMAMGNAEDLRKEATLLEQIEGGMADIYAVRAKQKPSLMQQFMDDETWFTAQDAVDMGLADRVDTSRDPVEPDEDEDEDVAAALRSNDPEKLLSLWGLGDVYQHCPTNCADGPQRLKMRNVRPSAQAQILAQVREFFEPPVVTGSPAKANATKEKSMKTKAQLIAALAVEIDPAKRAQLLRQLASHKDATEEEQTSFEIQAKAIEDEIAAGGRVNKEDELRRRAQVRDLFKPWGSMQADLMNQCLDNMDCPVDVAREKLLVALARTAEPIQGGIVTTIADARDKFRDGVTQALMFRSGLVTKQDPQNEYTGYSLRELARASLVKAGQAVPNDVMSMVGASFLTTSDFPAIMENVLNKALLKGFEEAPETFQLFTSVGNLSDFKQGTRVGMSEFSNLDALPEHGEYKAGKVLDKKETVQLATYGKVFNLTRQAIINDDLSALTRVPQGMGRAARRKIGDLVYAILTGGQTMTEDGVTLFHTATHKNYVEGAGTTLTAANLDIARTSMARQLDMQGIATLNVTPTFLVVPITLLGTATRLMKAETDITQANPKSPSIVQNMATIIADPRLDANSLTAWYLVASPSLFDTIEVQYLNGVQTPFMEQQTAWNVDGTSWKVRIDAAARALEWRTLYKSKGAA